MKVLIAIACLLIAGALVLLNFPTDRAADSEPVVEADSTGTVTSVDQSSAKVTEVKPAPTESGNTLSEDTPSVSDSDEQVLPESILERRRTDVTQIAHSSMSDGDFNNLIDNLGSDPSLLPALLDEYRGNTDLKRARRMAQALSSLQDPRITELGQEMVYSGDPGSQKAGFALLGGQQGRDPNALNTVVEMLDIETNPDVLQSAMNALATPGNTRTDYQQRIVDQLKTKATHDSAVIRSQSMSLISRWSGDEDVSNFYIAGMSDSDERVRSGAVLALKASNNTSDAAREALISVVQDNSAGRLLRLNALSTLKKFNLPASEMAQLKSLI